MQATAKDQSIPSRQHPRPDLRNLILVACHAVFVGSDYTKAEDHESWLLLDYQKVTNPVLRNQAKPLVCQSKVQQAPQRWCRCQGKHIPSLSISKKA